jgi:hypothetical protein
MIIKNTRSGKAVLVIDDFGRVFTIPKTSLSNFLSGVNGISVLTRLPFDVDPLRFRRSPVFWGGKVVSAEEYDLLDTVAKKFEYGAPDYMKLVGDRRRGNLVDIKKIDDFEVE